MEIPSNIQVTEITAYYTWMGNDGIARTKVKPRAEVTLAEAKENSVVVNSLSPGNLYPLLIDSRDIKSISKEARDFFSMNNRDSNVSAFAIIIQSPLSRVIGNFFMGLNKPRVPARLFKSEKEAVKWLKEL
ncbi:MAG: hypothetical protein K0S44_3119 [Bacteroidetes bacterium]|jgi:hypothetical protein|nr:hypothetical protein [Bacteroidota bacterium]